MNKFKGMQVVLALTVGVAAATAAWIYEARAAESANGDDGEVAVAWDDLPEAVRAALEKARPGLRPVELEKETENGKVSYDAEYKIDGSEIEYELAEDGTVLEIETEDDDDDDDEDGDDDDDDPENA
jgi:hypothetical protein